MYRKCYNVTFKLRAIAAAEGKSKEATAQEFKVDAQTSKTHNLSTL